MADEPNKTTSEQERDTAMEKFHEADRKRRKAQHEEEEKRTPGNKKSDK